MINDFDDFCTWMYVLAAILDMKNGGQNPMQTAEWVLM
jgi:hypothetical protein